MNIGPLGANKCLLTGTPMVYLTIWSSSLKKEKVCPERENPELKGCLAQKAKVLPGLGSSHWLNEAASCGSHCHFQTGTVTLGLCAQRQHTPQHLQRKNMP